MKLQVMLMGENFEASKKQQFVTFNECCGSCHSKRLWHNAVMQTIFAFSNLTSLDAKLQNENLLHWCCYLLLHPTSNMLADWLLTVMTCFTQLHFSNASNKVNTGLKIWCCCRFFVLEPMFWIQHPFFSRTFSIWSLFLRSIKSLDPITFFNQCQIQRHLWSFAILSGSSWAWHWWAFNKPHC